METTKILNELIAKYSISDEDVSALEEAMKHDGFIAEEEPEADQVE